jgi:hypothetical protein
MEMRSSGAGYVKPDRSAFRCNAVAHYRWAVADVLQTGEGQRMRLLTKPGWIAAAKTKESECVMPTRLIAKLFALKLRPGCRRVWRMR